jgi:ACS family glucarate transporter-like MFS transporter
MPPSAGRHSLPWKTAVRSGNFWWLLVMYFTHVWAAQFFTTWLYPFLENGRGYSKADIQNLSWIPFVLGAVANLLGGTASDLFIKRLGLKWARRVIGVAGHAFSGLMFVAVFFVEDKVWSIVFLALAYAGSDFSLPVCWAVCLDIGGKHSGAVSGAMNTLGNIGGFLTSVVFGYIVSGFGSYSLPMIPIFAMSFLSAIAFFKIDATRPLFEPPAPAPSPPTVIT